MKAWSNACADCRGKNIRCSPSLTDEWPCAACVRNKLHCVPLTPNHNRAHSNGGSLLESERPLQLDRLSRGEGDDYYAQRSVSPRGGTFNPFFPSNFFRTAFVCVDKAQDNNSLAGCKACAEGKRYYSAYAAAAHLRQVHFIHMETASGSVGEDRPSMEPLKDWTREIEELIPPDLAPYDDFNYIEDSQFIQSFGNEELQESKMASSWHPSTICPPHEPTLADAPNILLAISPHATPPRTPTLEGDESCKQYTTQGVESQSAVPGISLFTVRNSTNPDHSLGPSVPVENALLGQPGRNSMGARKLPLDYQMCDVDELTTLIDVKLHLLMQSTGAVSNKGTNLGARKRTKTGCLSKLWLYAYDHCSLMSDSLSKTKIEVWRGATYLQQLRQIEEEL